MKETLDIIPLLRDAFAYDPETGVVTYRRDRQGLNRRAGQRAGAKIPRGHRTLGFKKFLFQEHRVIFAMMTGRWPSYEIDHKNNVRDDNRWANLREATATQNKANSIYKNASGFKGAYYEKLTDKWQALISVKGKLKFLGRFETPELAHEAYKAAAIALHGEFARTDHAFLD